ncbi:putative inactive tyrosine-protein kinase Wsck isoform X2 [Condylostylus longicornis]|uniref:putative inactive tyrosine-protein kinase Wsck isoform X2 n=1 Tax=Condylostylus longicornis TaxID=2530218 RepID=UPI00244DC8E5|nr:putative inactive tyrosine-protein kinase Wsck isoform X2 [Condylostylus longicornis]
MFGCFFVFSSKNKLKRLLLLFWQIIRIINAETSLDLGDDYSYIGCLEENMQLLQQTAFAGSVNQCIEICEHTFFRYAVLSPGDKCTCSNHLDAAELDRSLCNTRCSRRKNQICGGVGAQSYYTTGLAGFPKDLRITNKSENSIEVRWTKSSQQEQVTSFIIKAVVIKTFATYAILNKLEWTVDRNEDHFELNSLHPGTEYNISVNALCVSEDCGSDFVIGETDIGDPDPLPREPKIVNRTETTLTVELLPSINNNGPISFYRIVVQFVDDIINQQFNEELLGNYNRSRLDGIPYYITAELRFSNMSQDFHVGDGFFYRRFYNAPLPPKAHVHIILGIVSSYNGITKIKYAQATHEQHNPLGIIFYDMIDDQQPSQFALIVACIIFGILVIFSILAYGILHYNTRNRRQRLSDTHELTVQTPTLEENSAFTSDEYSRGNFKTQLNGMIDHLDSSQKFPRNALRLNVNNVIGKGKFGELVTGKLYTDVDTYNCQVHVICDDMETETQSIFLKEFSQIINLMPHDKFLNFYGISATPDWFYIIFENLPLTLKTKLVESRIPYNMDNHRFSGFSEELAIRWIYEIATAMEYLEVNKVVHKKLSSYSIFLTENDKIKVSLFGATKNNDAGKSIDIIRWMAPEVIRFQHYSIKGDVWSFACVAWEICTLGATLYANVVSGDLFTQIKNGLRPEQPSFIFNDLYQLFLNCWQVEPNERPEFEEIAFNIRQILTSPRHALSYDRQEGLTIPYYLPLLEIQNYE